MLVFVTGVGSYVAFVLTSVWAVGFVENWLPSATLDGIAGRAGGGLGAALSNVIALALFGVQHALFARGPLRDALARFVPEAMQRSLHVLVSCTSLALVFFAWRPLPFELWNLELNALGFLLELASLAGFALAFAATFQFDHLELFGLRQAIAHARAEEPPEPSFDVPYLYRWVRQPIDLGLIVALWCGSRMTVGRVLFAGLVTAYLVYLARAEERELARTYREYRTYQQRVPMLLPRTKPLQVKRRAG